MFLACSWNLLWNGFVKSKQYLYREFTLSEHDNVNLVFWVIQKVVSFQKMFCHAYEFLNEQSGSEKKEKN